MGQVALRQAAHVSIAAQRDLENLDLDDLGILLAVIVDRFDGIVPSSGELRVLGPAFLPLSRAIAGRGGIWKVMPFLHATSEVLTPYLLVVGASLYANPMSLTAMSRDCLVEHVLLDGRSVVTWNKERSSRVQRRSFLRGRGLSVPNMIDQILEITAPLVRHTKSKHRQRLFLCGTRHRGTRVFGPYPHESSTNLNKFVRRNHLLGADGSALRLVLGTLRRTGLALAHEAVGGDVLKTQMLANHGDPTTTKRYVDRPAERERNAANLAGLQKQFVDSVQRGVLAHVDAARGAKTADTRNVTASGFTCVDPLAGVGPGQKAGELCTAWLGCFTCPNAVIPLTVDVLARLLLMKEALVLARARLPAERWDLVYGPKLSILERDILVRFPARMVAAAMVAREHLNRLPPIE